MARRPHPTNLLPEARRYAQTVCRPFERTPCVRNVLKTSSTEVPEEASGCVVGIHSRLPSSIGVPLTTVLSPSLGCLSSPSPQRAVPCSPWLRAAPAAPGAGSARPRAALRLRGWETPVDDHDGDPLRPRLPALLGDTASQRAIEVRYPSVETQDPCRPCLTHIFPSPIRLLAAAPRPASPGGLPAARAPATAAAQPDRHPKRRRARVDVPGPRPTPALHAIDRHDPGDARGEQRQRIKGPLAHPQGAGA